MNTLVNVNVFKIAALINKTLIIDSPDCFYEFDIVSFENETITLSDINDNKTQLVFVADLLNNFKLFAHPIHKQICMIIDFNQ